MRALALRRCDACVRVFRTRAPAAACASCCFKCAWRSAAATWSYQHMAAVKCAQGHMPFYIRMPCVWQRRQLCALGHKTCAVIT